MCAYNNRTAFSGFYFVDEARFGGGVQRDACTLRAPQKMAFYFATSQKPTAVGQAAVGAFTGPNDVNLALGKTTRLEIHRYTAEGLELVLDIAVNGRIANMKMIRISVSSVTVVCGTARAARARPGAACHGACTR